MSAFQQPQTVPPIQTDLNRDLLAASQQRDDIQILTFLLGDETYGIDILQVQEIRGWERVTQLPNTPVYVKGVINMRGAVVPIVDLRKRFDIGQPSYNETTVVIIARIQHGQNEAKNSMNSSEKTVGFVVDGVSDVENVDFGELQTAPNFSMRNNVDSKYIKGLANLADAEKGTEKMVILLDVGALIHSGHL